MHQRIRSRLTFANVVSLVALFVALGGTATAVTYVVSSNSQVGPNTISGHHPPSGDHANIVSGSVNGQDLGAAAVTGGKVASNAINGGKIVDGSVGRADLSAAAVGARAWAFVGGRDNCPTAVSFCQLVRSKGVGYAVHVGTGSYCVGVNGINAADPGSIAVVAPVQDSADAWATWRGATRENVNCVRSEFEVDTGVGANPTNEYFTIVIP